MLKKKIVAVAVLGSLIVSLFTGCSFTAKKEATEIYFLSCKPEVKAVWEEVSEAYEKETGVKLKVLTAADGNHERTLKAELAKKDSPTMFQINGPVEYQKWKNYCLDLSGTDLYSWMLDKNMAVTDGSGVYGIPYVVEGYGIIYNQAIMDKYFSLSGRATTYTSVDEINDFAKLKEVAEDMQAHKSELGIEGVFASTSFAPGENWRWQTHLLNIPMYYEFKDKGVSDSDTFDFTYSNNYKSILDLYMDNSCTDKSDLGNKTVEDSMSEFAQGKVAMVQNGNWGWTQIESADGNVVSEDQVKYMPIYTGMPDEQNQGLCIGTENYICINSQVSEEKQQASIDFLEWLYSSDEGKAFVTNEFGFIPPFNTFDESEYPANPLAKEVLNYMNDSSKESISWNFVAMPSQTFKDDLGTNLLSYATGELDWNSLVNMTKAEWASEKQKEGEE